MYRKEEFTRLGNKLKTVKFRNFSSYFTEKTSDIIDKDIQLSAMYTIFATVYADGKNANIIISYYQRALDTIKTIPVDRMSKEQKIKYFYLLIFNNVNMGISHTLYLCTPNLEKAEHYFLKALAFSKSHPEYFKIAELNIYYSVAYFYFRKKDYLKCIEYSEKLLEAEKNENNPEIRLFAYENLEKSYQALNDSLMQSKYLKLSKKLSTSLIRVKKDPIVSDFGEKKVNIKWEVSNLKEHFLLSVVLIKLTILAVGMRFYNNNNNLKKKYFVLIRDLEKNKDLNNYTPAANYQSENNKIIKANISSDKEKAILKKISKFEASEKFLRKNLTITYLSSLFDTNPKYLSQIIREHKGLNFNSYINQLRINYISNKLYNSLLYREYKISYLAEECGYTYQQVFINAFRKETGMTPSYFINLLKKQNSV